QDRARPDRSRRDRARARRAWRRAQLCAPGAGGEPGGRRQAPGSAGAAVTGERFVTASSATPASTDAGPARDEAALASSGGDPVRRAFCPAWAVPGGHVLLLWHGLKHWRMLFNPMVQLVFLRQVYFVGVQGLRVIALLAFATGGLFVTEATSVLG